MGLFPSYANHVFQKRIHKQTEDYNCDSGSVLLCEGSESYNSLRVPKESTTQPCLNFSLFFFFLPKFSKRSAAEHVLEILMQNLSHCWNDQRPECSFHSTWSFLMLFLYCISSFCSCWCKHMQTWLNNCIVLC